MVCGVRIEPLIVCVMGLVALSSVWFRESVGSIMGGELNVPRLEQ